MRSPVSTHGDAMIPSVVRSREKAPPKWLRVLSLAVVAVIPIVFMTMGISGLVHVRHVQSLLRPLPGGTVTTGTVLGSHVSCFRSCTYEPHIRYTDRDGNPHTFTAPYQSDYPAVGSTVKVSYNPKVPSEAHNISNGPSSWSFELFTMIFLITISGLFVTGGGLAAVLLRRKRAKARTTQDVGVALGVSA